MNRNTILKGDLQYIYTKLSEDEKTVFEDSTILITGCGGFLGYYFVHFLAQFSKILGIRRVIALENFLTGTKDWLDNLVSEHDHFSLFEFDITKDSLDQISEAKNANLIIHGASIASPTYYRIYPLETIDANIWGLRRLFEFYKNRSIDGLLFFSSSEIYGDPFPEFIPTKEDYRGNVETMGPRACYDEAKRFGETLCYVFNQKYGLPVSIARPFNNYGPGMNVNDKRLPADFAKSVLERKDLVMFSDGSPTRTFCYIADAITGYLKVLSHKDCQAFNIGIDKPEISVREFAEIYIKESQRVFDYNGKVVFQTSDDKQYMTDNPNRRCPDISKAREILGYEPSIYVEEGVSRFLNFLKQNNGKLI